MIGDIFCLFFFLFQWHDSFYTCRETRQDKNGSSRLLVLMLLFCSMKRGIRLVSTKWTEKRLFFSFFFLFFNIFGALCGWGCSDHALAHTQRGEIRQTKNPNIRLRNEKRMCVFFFLFFHRKFTFYFFIFFFIFIRFGRRLREIKQTHRHTMSVFFYSVNERVSCDLPKQNKNPLSNFNWDKNKTLRWVESTE